MNKRFFYIFLLICSAGFLILPQNCYSSEYKLSEFQTHNILNSCQQELIDEWLNIFPSFEPEKEAALFLIRNGIQKKELSYWLEEVPKEYLKTLVKISAFLLVHPDISAVLDKIEKETVKQAVKIAKEWLLQNEIKIANGPLKYAYVSYKGNKQEPDLHYIISYHCLNNQKAEVIIEFYSPERVEPQKATASMLWVGRSSWDLESWLKAGNKKLDPFIVRVKGKVDETYGSYAWDKSTTVEVTFSEPVPEYPFEPEPSSFWQKIKKAIENEISGVFKDFEDIFDVFTEIKKQIPNPAAFEAQVSQPLSLMLQEGKLKEAEQAISSLEEEIKELNPEEVGSLSTLDLDEMQEKIDDIKEMIDVFSEELEKIIEERAQYASKKEHKEETQKEVKEEEPAEENEEETEEEAELDETEEEIEESLAQEIPVVLCQRNQSSSPLRNKIIFNEIAWMGTTNSANDEWLELKNISNQEINLSGWQILDKDARIKIAFQQEGAISKIPANGFYLLERTDDETVPNIIADFIYTGALNNSNEALYLFDQDCQLQDEVLANPDWLAGDKSSKRTMERKTSLGWQTSANINGTPKAKNSRGYSESSGGGGGSSGSTPEDEETAPEDEETAPEDEETAPDEDPEEEPDESEEPEQPEYLFQDVVINEIAWAGTKASAQDEWIELYNNSQEEIDISGWKLISSDNSPEIIFSPEAQTPSTAAIITTTIPSDGFYLIERTDNETVSDIPANWFGSFGRGLNNDGEKLELRDSNDRLIDLVDCSSDWFAGNSSPDYISMERIHPELSGSEPGHWLSNNGIIINGLDAGNENQENKQAI